jgi:hypothetical protein
MATKARLWPSPEIWCLTGLFEMSGVTAATVIRKNPSATIGVSSALIGAISGVPIGGSIEIGKDFTVTCDNKYPGSATWAAQYQLINSRPVLRVDTKEDLPINYVEVYPDYTYAKGAVLGGGDPDDQEEAFMLEVEDEDEDEEIDVDIFDEEYWKAYGEAEELTKERNNLTGNDGAVETDKSSGA